MTKHLTKSGFTYYKTSMTEVLSWGGMCICDECGEFHPEGGYLVPVLNHWQCERCFKDWEARSKHYPEDDDYENRVSEYYEKLLGFTESA